jgi:phage baseplate assembly protein W
MTTLATTYTNYQLSAIGVGAIATGLEDIRQCIDFILRTIPGSDPLRPLFGSNVYRFMDAPVNSMVPNLKKEIFEALNLWEPRITVTSITHEITLGQVAFNISYQVNDSSILDSLSWSFSGIIQVSESTSGVIISAAIPVKVPFGYYNVSFVVDGKAVFPPTPAYGFASAETMLAWINENWFAYGRWYISGQKLVLYLNYGVAKKASLVVSQFANITLKASINPLSSGEYYTLALTIEGKNAIPEFPVNSIATIEQLLNWLSSFWSQYGSWSIENNGITITSGDFSDDFNYDFNIGGIEIDRSLIFQTNKYLSATLTFI